MYANVIYYLAKQISKMWIVCIIAQKDIDESEGNKYHDFFLGFRFIDYGQEVKLQFSYNTMSLLFKDNLPSCQHI